MQSSILKVKLRKEYYEIPIDSKYTFIRGKSATGKTRFISLLRSPTVNIDYSLPVRLFPESVMEHSDPAYALDVLFEDVSLICIDEDSIIDPYDKFPDMLKNSKHLFLVISRYNFNKVPYSPDDVFEFISEGYYTKAVPRYLAYDKVPNKKYRNIFVEDSQSGYEFFKCINKDVLTSGGKNLLVSDICKYRDSIFIADRLGFGSSMDKATINLIEHPTNNLLLIDSFESLVYKSEFINGEAIPDIACRNVEEFYTAILKQELNRYGIVYTKSTLTPCLYKNCCISSKKCPLYYRVSKLRYISGDLYDIISNLGKYDQTGLFE